MSATTAAWLVLAAPLAGTIVDRRAASTACRGAAPAGSRTGAIAVSFVFALITLDKLQQHTPGAPRADLDAVDDRRHRRASTRSATLLVDPLSVLMICVVAGVSTLIHLYSIGYMEGDRGYARFFAYLNFFVFSMLLLVLAGNFLLLLVGWAFVGAASYLLIGFWYRRTTATERRHQGVRDQRARRHRPRARHLLHLPPHPHASTSLGSFHAAPHVFASGSGDITAGCLLLLVGAFAKSAQIPLHTWLPDAMEGPTPVSALIHAATMVTAGVYLIARMHPLFQLAPAAGDVGAIIGALTLLIAGTIGLAADRHQARDRLLDDVADRLHDHGRLGRRLHRRAVPPDDARLLQGAAVHGRRLADLRRWAASQSLDRMSGLPPRAAVHLRLLHHRRPRADRRAAVQRLLLQGRASCCSSAGRGGWHWALYVAGYLGAFLTGALHVPDDLPRLPRRAVPGGASS